MAQRRVVRGDTVAAQDGARLAANLDGGSAVEALPVLECIDLMDQLP